MDRGIRAKHVASFLEYGKPLSGNEIMENLESVENQPSRTILDCYLKIVDGEYLIVRVDGDPDPSECFDLCYIDDVHGYSWSNKANEYPLLLVFRFLASKITDGETPNEVHIFSLESKSQLQWVVDFIDEAVGNAKQMNKQSKPRHQPTRKMSRKSDAIDRPEKIKRHPKESSSSGTKGKLEEMNQLLDDIEAFETALHGAVSYQVTGATKVDRSLWRDSLTPPSYEAAVAHVERIRKCVNFTADLTDYIVDPGPGELLNRLFESLNWVQKLCDGNRVLHYDPNLVRSVKRPAFTERAIRTLSECLQPDNKSFWHSLGDAWTTAGMKSDAFSTDYLNSTRAATADRAGFKPEMTIKDYGYYSTTCSTLSSTQEKKDESIDMEGFINGVRARGGTLVIAKQKTVSEAARELSINVGDVLEVLDDNGEWCCLRTPTGQTGHVPRKCIEVLEDHVSENKTRSISRTRSKSPPEKKQSTNRRSSSGPRKFKRAPRDSEVEAEEDVSEEYYSDEGVHRQSTSSRTTKHRSCMSCCDGGTHPCHHHHHHSVSPSHQEQLPVTPAQQYQPMNVQPLQQRQTGQPIIHHGTNGQPSVIVVPTSSNQPAQPRPPPVHYLVTQPPPPPQAPPQPVIVPMPFPMQQPVMQQPMMQQPMMQQPMMQQPMMQQPMMQPPLMPGMGPYGMYGTMRRGTPNPMDPYYDGYMDYEGLPRRRRSSASPKRRSRQKHKDGDRRRKKSERSSSNSSSTSSSSSSRSSSSSKEKKHSKSKKGTIPQAPPPPPPPPKEDTYDISNQTVRKQRLLTQMPGPGSAAYGDHEP
uniref:SH3 domain-containing protein n=2 Tax=Mesocestoides corti TaxID=53468 RepID=A0A5K3EPS9_MESCO